MSEPGEPMTAVAAHLFTARIEEAAENLERAVRESEKLRASNRRGRATVIVLWILAVYVAVTLHDEHIHRCMLVEVAEPPKACNVIFPFHDHDSIQERNDAEIKRVIREERSR